MPSFGEYVLYGPDISLFTRKLEAALRFYGLPVCRAAKDRENAAELETRSGTHQVPVLQTPENWMLADTTPILRLLDAQRPARALYPEGPLGVLVHVVEEILDEWFARTMVHYRWHYEENTRHIAEQLLARQVSPEEAREFPLAEWGRRACRATGTESLFQQKAAEREYLELMAVFEEQLAETPFALGGRPTAADAMLLGGLRGHTNADPIPDLGAFPRVLEWDAKGADSSPWGELAAFPESTPVARHLIGVGAREYAPFVLGNARALEAGEKAFVIPTYGEDTSYLARSYPERSRQMIRDRIEHQLDTAERDRVESWLESVGLSCFRPA